MKPFMDSDFLLQTDTAKKLYHDYAKQVPVLDYHCHLVPKEIAGDVYKRQRHGTKFNGAPYIIQRAGEAVYSEAGKAQTKEQIAYYMNNAKEIRNALSGMGYTVFGGVNAPYIWLQTPAGIKSWDFFDMLLEQANVVGTPGSGFGPRGEGYFRLTAFGSAENTKKALERIKACLLYTSSCV